ncbi:MAG TPA: LysM domain-containing protein [Planctomycetota bacterium]|jgi:nucleoid-associated protein YgaU|nr:LysM domain-containing protein [Planctomycetota bacterium]
MVHLERAAVATVVVLVGILLGVSLYWTGEVTRTARHGGATSEPVALESPAWDLSRPLPEPTPLGPEALPPASTVPIAVPRRLEERAGPGSSGGVGGEKTYEVRDGDRLETIAVRETGSRKGIEAILEANPGLDPDRIRVGRRIRIPARETDSEKARGSARAESAPAPRVAPPQRAYSVKGGDTLWSLATRLLGDGKRWREIVDKNPALLGKDRPLREGMLLEIP